MKDFMLLLIGGAILIAVVTGEGETHRRISTLEKQPINVVIEQPVQPMAAPQTPVVVGAYDNVPKPVDLVNVETTEQLEERWVATGQAFPGGYFVMSREQQREWLLQNVR